MTAANQVALLAGLDQLPGKRILVLGGINVDDHLVAGGVPPDDGCELLREIARSPGGHAGNCAAALAALGTSPGVFGAVGADADGRMALDDLAQSGVNTSTVLVWEALPTGRVFIPHLGARRYMLMHRGANDAPALVMRLSEIAWSSYDYVVVFDPPIEIIERLIALKHRITPRICWNPGGLLVKHARFATLTLLCTTVILNEVEAAIALGDGPPETRYARAFGDRTDGRLVITTGARGSVLVTRGSTSVFPAFPVPAIDTTGAGDAFTAAFAAMDAAGAIAADCLQLANIAGALATRKLGSRASLATASELRTALAGHHDSTDPVTTQWRPCT